MELETINKLFLELSQVATAKTANEIALEKLLAAAEPAADGWVDFAKASVKDYGDATVVLDTSGTAWVLDGRDEYSAWVPEHKTTKEELDAAYAAHVAAKPVLVWDDKAYDFPYADAGEFRYVCSPSHSVNHWRAGRYNVNGVIVLGDEYKSRDAAKAACERHARGE